MSDSARRLPRIEGRGNWAVVRPVFEQRFKSEGLWDAVSNKTAAPESDKAKALVLENIASDLVALVDATQTAGHAWALLITLFSDIDQLQQHQQWQHGACPPGHGRVDAEGGPAQGQPEGEAEGQPEGVVRAVSGVWPLGFELPDGSRVRPVPSIQEAE